MIYLEFCLEFDFADIMFIMILINRNRCDKKTNILRKIFHSLEKFNSQISRKDFLFSNFQFYTLIFRFFYIDLQREYKLLSQYFKIDNWIVRLFLNFKIIIIHFARLYPAFLWTVLFWSTISCVMYVWNTRMNCKHTREQIVWVTRHRHTLKTIHVFN